MSHSHEPPPRYIPIRTDDGTSTKKINYSLSSSEEPTYLTPPIPPGVQIQSQAAPAEARQRFCSPGTPLRLISPFRPPAPGAPRARRPPGGSPPLPGPAGRLARPASRPPPGGPAALPARRQRARRSRRPPAGHGPPHGSRRGARYLRGARSARSGPAARPRGPQHSKPRHALRPRSAPPSLGRGAVGAIRAALSRAEAGGKTPPGLA